MKFISNKKYIINFFIELLINEDIKKLNIKINFYDNIIQFNKIIYSSSNDLIIGILFTCIYNKQHIIETSLIGKNGQQIYDEDLGYVNVLYFYNISELITHLYTFGNGILL